MSFALVNAAFPSLDFPLQLHFDVNKTVIISDPVSGITTEQMLNSILSECIWGTLKCSGKPDDELHSPQEICNLSPEDWTICSIQPSRSPPIENSITYGEFLECYGPGFNMTRKDTKSMKVTFTEEGMPGEKVSATFEQLKKFMRHSSTLGDERGNIRDCYESAHDQFDGKISDKSSMSNDGTSVKLKKNCLAPILDSGYYHLLPSFLKLISYLHQKKCDFQIILRTFGIDIQRVAEELNMYCEGKHPLFPLDDILPSQPIHSDEIEKSNSSCYIGSTEVRRVKMDGVVGVDRRLHCPRCLGVMRRTSDTGDGISFEHTTSSGDVETVHGFEGMQSVMHSWSVKESSWIGEKSSSHHDGAHDEVGGMSTIRTGGGTAAVQDDFSYWHSQHESDHSGKLFLVNAERVSASSSQTEHGRGADIHSAPMHFFFDDNVERDRAHIVDVRDAKTFEKVPFSLSENVFIRKVEPYFAIVNENYFIETLCEMVDAQTAYRHRRESADAK